MVFIDCIKLLHVRNLPAIDIALDKEECKHLILTGPNGSGKTTLLNELKRYLQELSGNITSFCNYALKDAQVSHYEELFTTPKANIYQSVIADGERKLRNTSAAEVHLADLKDFYSLYLRGDFLICSFDAHRKAEFIEPKGPSKIELKKTLEEGVGKYFVQLLVNLRSRRSFARDENDLDTVQRIKTWFDNFEEALATLLGHRDFQLKFDSTNFNFTIQEKDKEPYRFSELSDGYSALLSIVAELMIRMSLDPLLSYDKQGIVLIDEVENHLHVELQKKVMPFLTAFFPKLQFIVTTHSPFVLSSIKNSVIFDLEKRERYTDFSEYSYSSIIEDYYGINTYSDSIVNAISEIEKILQKEVLSHEEIVQVKQMYDSIRSLPEIEKQLVSPELRVKLNSLILNNISKLNGIF